MPRDSPGVSREHEIVIAYARLVAGKTRLVLCFVDRLPIDETTESPATGGSIFLRVLDHHLYRGRLAGDGRRRELGGWRFLPRELYQDRTVGKGQVTAAVSLDRLAVTQDGADLI